MVKKITIYSVFVFVLAMFAAWSYWYLATPRYLTFSDSARYADAARNLLTTPSLVVNHTYFNTYYLTAFTPNWNFLATFPPVTSLLLNSIFRLFPVTDFTMFVSGSILFALCASLVFLIAYRLHSISAALIASTLFTFNLFFLEYAVNFSSEIIFIILLLIFTYLLFFSRRFLSLIPLSVMFFTRQQAPLVLLASLIFLTKKLAILMAAIFVAIMIFFPNSAASPQSLLNSFGISSSVAQGNYLRGLVSTTSVSLVSKIFYNLYNFAKSPERIISFPLLIFFIVGLFFKIQRRFFIFSLLLLLLLLLASSATLPNARYIHPIIPLVIICASISLVELTSRLKLSKILLQLLLLLLLIPTIGQIFVDYRFRRQQQNIGQPPATKVISDIISLNIPKGRLIITNLDVAWPAWYHGLTTMWFPLSPDLIPANNAASYIVLTNFREGDADFSLGSWHDYLYSSTSIPGFNFVKSIDTSPESTYDNIPLKISIWQKS